MASKLDKLKKKLLQQQEKSKVEFLKVPKPKKKDRNISLRQVDQRNIEDKNMRAFLRKIASIDTTNIKISHVRDAFNEYYRNDAVPAIKKADPTLPPSEIYDRAVQLWSDLPQDVRYMAIIRAYGNKKDGAWGRRTFINRLTSLNTKLIDLFVKSYLKQNISYPLYFEEWIELPDIAPEVEDAMTRFDEGGITIAPTGADELYEKAIQRSQPSETKEKIITRQEFMDNAIAKANEYAQKHGVATEAKNYYGILNDIATAKNPKLVKKLMDANELYQIALAKSKKLRKRYKANKIGKTTYKKRIDDLQLEKREDQIERIRNRLATKAASYHPIVLADIIARAREMGIMDPDKMSIGDIYIAMRHYNPKTRERLLDVADEYKIQGVEDLNVAELREKIHKTDQSLSSRERASRNRKKLDEIHSKVKASKYEGVTEMVRDNDLVDFERLSNEKNAELAKLSDTQLIALAKSLGISSNVFNRTKLQEKIAEIQLEPLLLVNVEKVNLARKLAILMDVPVQTFREWEISALQSKYDSLGGGLALEESKHVDDIDEALEESLTGQNYTQLARTVRTCTNQRYKFPWIKMNVQDVYIAAAPGKSLDMFFTKTDSVPVNFAGVEWYSAGVRFSILQCTALSRTQEGNVLSCVTYDRKPVEFMVAYLVKSHNKMPLRPSELMADGRRYIGASTDSSTPIRVFSSEGPAHAWAETDLYKALIIQNTELFNKEKEYLAWKMANRADRVLRTLDEQHSASSISTAAVVLSKALRKVAPDIKDYGQISWSYKDKGTGQVLSFHDQKTIYISQVMKNLGITPRDSNRELFAAVADIIVYLDLSQAKTFRKRIRAEYYLPDSLAILSPSDKLPEVFDNPNVSELDQQRMSIYIGSKKKSIVADMAEDYYRATHPTETRSIRRLASQQDIEIKGAFLNRLGVCQNVEEIIDKDPEDIIIYTDKRTNVKYCFPIATLLKSISSGNTINPKTGEKFSDKFLQRISRIYNIELKKGGILQQQFADKYQFDLPKEMQKQETGVDDDAMLEKEVEKAFMIIPNMWEIVVKDIAEREEDMAKDHSEETSASVSEDQSSESKESSESSLDEPTRRGDTAVAKEDLCEYCKKHVSEDSGYKSVIFHDDTARIVRFCNVKCFEDKDFPKIKGRKKSKRRTKKK